MKPISSVKYFYLTTFANPPADRSVYRAVKKNRASSILEIGLGNGDRAENLIRIAKKFSASGTVRYTGIDMFESAPTPVASLKETHQRLSRHDVKLQLVPGPIFNSVLRIANSHTRTDILVISEGVDQESLQQSWFYFPRMLHAASVILMQDQGGDFKRLSRLEIERKIGKTPASKDKAA